MSDSFVFDKDIGNLQSREVEGFSRRRAGDGDLGEFWFYMKNICA